MARVELVGAMRRPRGSLVAGLPQVGRDGEAALDDLTWRLVGQLSLNHLSLAEECKGAEPLRAMLELYADRGDPALARHVRSLTRVTSRPVIERLDLPGPLCLGKGIEITLHIDEGPLSGGSACCCCRRCCRGCSPGMPASIPLSAPGRGCNRNRRRWHGR